MSDFLYQPLADPLLPPAAGAETVTVDKWHRHQAVPVRRVASIAAIAMACVLPPTFAQGSAAAPTDWRPTAPDAISRKAPAREGLTVWPLYVPDVTAPVTALSWRPHYPAHRLPPGGIRASLPQAFTVDTVANFQAAAVPALSVVVAPSWVARRPPLAHFHAAQRTDPIYVADVTVVAPALSWSPRYPDAIPPALALRVALQKAVTADKLTEPGAVDLPPSTQGWYPDRVLGRRPLTPSPSHASPLVVPDVTYPVVALSWGPTFPPQVPAARRPVNEGGAVMSAREVDPEFAPESRYIIHVRPGPDTIYVRPVTETA